MYPPTGKVYISRHVIFDEECFPFREAYKNLVPRYETTLLKAWQKATFQTEEPVTEQITRILHPNHIEWSQEKCVHESVYMTKTQIVCMEAKLFI